MSRFINQNKEAIKSFQSDLQSLEQFTDMKEVELCMD
jgi:hypothetical protein